MRRAALATLLWASLSVGWAQESCRAIDGDTLPGVVVAIADGDTLTLLDACKQQRRIRLSDIDAPNVSSPSVIAPGNH